MRWHLGRRLFLPPAITSVLAVILSTSAAPRANGADGSKDRLPGRAELRDALERLWDSLATFEFTCDARVLSEEGVPAQGGSILRTHFIKGPDGKSSVKQMSIAPDGRMTILDETLKDGVRSYRIGRAEGRDVVTDLIVQNQEGNESYYKGSMNQVLWLLMPGGRPLHSRLDAGAKLEAEDVADRRRLVLTFEHKGSPVRCALDGEHEWLPIEVRIGRERPLVTKVTRFGRDRGRWFPAEGVYEGSPAGQIRFEAGRFAVNEPVPAASFRPPPLPDGTLVYDATVNKSYVKGGPAARERLLRAVRPTPGDRPVASGSGVPLLGRLPGLPRWDAVIALIAGGCLLASLALRIGRHRRPQGAR